MNNDKMREAQEIMALGRAVIMHEQGTQKEMLCFYPDDFKQAVLMVFEKYALSTHGQESEAQAICYLTKGELAKLRTNNPPSRCIVPVFLAPPSALAIETAAKRKAAEVLKDWQRGQKVKWISVEDSLPSVDGHYLCFDGSNVDVALFLTDINPPAFTSDSMVHEGYITHWMPLPEPPKDK